MTKAEGKKPGRVDWEAVERDYRTGRFTNVELCRKHACDPATLSRKIKKDQALDPARWQKDLTEAVRQATNARLMVETVKAEVKEGQESVKDSIKAAAEVNTQIILGHRDRVRRAADVAMRMLAELDATTLKPAELEALWAQASGADKEEDPTIKRALMRKLHDLMDLHSRVASVQKLMVSIKEAQNVEAQAFGNLYDPAKPKGKELADLTDEEIDRRLSELEAKQGQA